MKPLHPPRRALRPARLPPTQAVATAIRPNCSFNKEKEIRRTTPERNEAFQRGSVWPCSSMRSLPRNWAVASGNCSLSLTAGHVSQTAEVRPTNCQCPAGGQGTGKGCTFLTLCPHKGGGRRLGLSLRAILSFLRRKRKKRTSLLLSVDLEKFK